MPFLAHPHHIGTNKLPLHSSLEQALYGYTLTIWTLMSQLVKYILPNFVWEFLKRYTGASHSCGKCEILIILSTEETCCL